MRELRLVPGCCRPFRPHPFCKPAAVREWLAEMATAARRVGEPGCFDSGKVSLSNQTCNREGTVNRALHLSPRVLQRLPVARQTDDDPAPAA